VLQISKKFKFKKLEYLNCSIYVLFMGKFKNHCLVSQDQALRSPQLGELMGQSVQVEAWCNWCGHYRMMDPEHLINRLGPQIRVPEIGVYIECESCSSKNIAARPAYTEYNHFILAAAE
jgi:hypothetical protein